MKQWPFVSVVIPMRNEERHIRRCIDSILAQDYPRERFEILVVDGDSDDRSHEILASYGEQIRVLRNPARIVPTAMNIGIRAARGEIIARVDAHTTIEPDYLRRGVETLMRTGADNVGGPMRTVGGGRVGDAIARAMDSPFGIGAYFHFAREDREVDTVYMGMWPRQTFERIGLFDEELVRNQDDELNYRLRKNGGRIFLTLSMRSHYQNRQTYRALAEQFFQYGLWKVRVLQKHPRQMGWRHFVPPGFVACCALAPLLSFYQPWVLPMTGILVTSYFLLTFVAALGVARQHRWSLLPYVLVAFLVIHGSWGSGFLLGLVRFAPRWWRPDPPPPRLESMSLVAAASNTCGG